MATRGSFDGHAGAGSDHAPCGAARGTLADTAGVTLIAISYLAQVATQLPYLVRAPLPFALASLEPLALVFFFTLLARHAEDRA